MKKDTILLLLSFILAVMNVNAEYDSYSPCKIASPTNEFN